jgi:hypothetical protein
MHSNVMHSNVMHSNVMHSNVMHSNVIAGVRVGDLGVSEGPVEMFPVAWQYGGVSKKSFPSEVRFPLFRPYLVAPPNRSPRQRLYTPSPVKNCLKVPVA